MYRFWDSFVIYNYINKSIDEGMLTNSVYNVMERWSVPNIGLVDKCLYGLPIVQQLWCSMLPPIYLLHNPAVPLCLIVSVKQEHHILFYQNIPCLGEL